MSGNPLIFLTVLFCFGFLGGMMLAVLRVAARAEPQQEVAFREALAEESVSRRKRLVELAEKVQDRDSYIQMIRAWSLEVSEQCPDHPLPEVPDWLVLDEQL
jgi:hypothetical protein